jgi:Na+/melibiose symporter-like transporter
MSLLHSFYAWGFIVVVLATTAMLAVFGKDNWPVIVIVWSILPLLNFFNFLRVPLAPQVSEEHRTAIGTLGRSRYFLMVVLGIALGGAAEVTMSQWTSAYVESALALPKVVGDLVGLCLFAGFLGTGRALYGKFGKHIDVWYVMFWGSIFHRLLCSCSAFSMAIGLSGSLFALWLRSIAALARFSGECRSKVSVCRCFSFRFTCSWWRCRSSLRSLACRGRG